MKWFPNLLLITGAGFAGYFLEPSLRKDLTGIGPKDAQAVDPAIAKIDPMSYLPDQLPKEVMLKKDAQLTDSASGLKMTISANNRVKLLRMEDGKAVVSAGAETIQGMVEFADTDIREQLASQQPTAAPVSDPGMTAATEATITPPPAATPARTMEPTAPEPSIAVAENTPTPEPAMEPTPKPPVAAVEAVPDGFFAAISAEDIVKIMQESIQSGQIKEFKFDQVSSWTGGDAETVDGKQFNTGLVSYKGQTFLGVKTIQAKAYIENGKVARWIMPKSGMEIK